MFLGSLPLGGRGRRYRYALASNSSFSPIVLCLTGPSSHLRGSARSQRNGTDWLGGATSSSANLLSRPTGKGFLRIGFDTRTFIRSRAETWFDEVPKNAPSIGLCRKRNEAL